MIVLLDSNILISALLSSHGAPAHIVDQWRAGRFHLLTCQQQIDANRTASRAPKFKDKLQPHHIGTLLNNLYGATVWTDPLPRKHQAADPADSFLVDLIDAAQPDYAVPATSAPGSCNSTRWAEPRS